ncbi:MAG: hypothetical protein AAGG01_24195, partial [Planctomycetota bacterium]
MRKMAVAWISAVNDPGWSLWSLLALFAWERARERDRAPWLSGVLTLIALMTKEQAIVTPLLILALEATSGRSLRTLRGARLVALVAPVLAWFAARAVVFGEASGGLLREYGDYGFTASREATFRIELFGGLMRHLAWPDSPAVFRPIHPVLPESSNALAVGIGASIAFLAALAFAVLRKRRGLALGLLLTGIVILPIAAAPDRTGLYPLSDRYLYLATFGGSLAAVAALLRLVSMIPLFAGVVLASGAMFTVARGHQPTFADELTFRVAGVEDAPRSPNVLWGAGRAFLSEYVRTQNNEMLFESYLHYLRSLKSVSIYGDGSFVDDPKRPYAERIGKLEHLILNTPASERRVDPTVFATFDDRFQATLGQIQTNLLLAENSTDPDLDYPLALALGARDIPEFGQRPELESVLAEIHARRGELEEAKAA